MTTKVDIGNQFKGDLRRLVRKYPLVLNEVDSLITQLERDKRPGDKIPQAGYDVYKVRMRNPSARKGKSGGFRMIYYVRLVDNILLLTIYSKSQQEDILLDAIRRLIENQ